MCRHDDGSVWRCSDGSQVHVQDQELLDGHTTLAMASVWELGVPLGPCVGPPLATPPAGDPGGFRKLAFDGATWMWALELTGDNRCGLQGTLLLPIDGARPDPTGLACGPLPWRAGGVQACRQTLAAELRARAVVEWPELSDHDRAGVVLSLERDPDPDATRVLTELAALDPTWAPRIERALSAR